ncbi:ClbS/DfsB family four-helix bundle protein [Listeria costaricensis]|uniref:ClbS/DfsB family four-helix bundle protein n=1 Tax=Listeria costaricensis TaxID=2026604 RepID=UPI000C069D4D|nr:ClbS/DfsB family four-helix bundle protein [Listeria costaricensis]
MKQYQNKQELVEAVQQSYQKFRTEFTDVPEPLSDQRVEAVDKTPKEMLAYQLGWLTLVLSWEQEEQAGKKVITPTPEYKWNQLGPLYQSFYEQYGKVTLKKQLTQLDQLVATWISWIETLPDEVLFEAGKRDWATTKAMWPVYKWIHINSVAPFTNFRPKIRKWKKQILEN